MKSVYTGKQLGMGSFCVVQEIVNVIATEGSGHLDPKKHPYLALKRPRDDLTPEYQEKTRVDLMKEISLLSKLKHENIVHTQHSTDSGCTVPENLIMERLEGTLSWKIKQWRAKTRSAKKFLRPKGSYQLSDLYNHQMAAILDISKAMMFLHSRDILMLDLKPENCGFDVNGKLKLFDFGLATNLDDKKKVGPDQYLLDKFVGTPRYMSPEVARGCPYGKACDVYSFALVCWEILALETPFASMAHKDLVMKVYQEQQRPKVAKRWPALMQSLIHRSWYHNPRYRPQFHEIKANLVDIASVKLEKNGGCFFKLRSIGGCHKKVILLSATSLRQNHLK